LAEPNGIVLGADTVEEFAPDKDSSRMLPDCGIEFKL